jgi:hypothetical protein
MNLLFEPVLVPLVLDVPLLLVDEPLLLPPPLLLVPLLSLPPFFTANAEVTRPPILLDAVTRDIAVTIASIANPVVITFFLYIGQYTPLFIKNRLLNKVNRLDTRYTKQEYNCKDIMTELG